MKFPHWLYKDNLIAILLRLRGSRLIAFLHRHQGSILYPLLFGAICVLSGTNGIAVYKPCIYLLTVIVVLIGLHARDMKFFLVPAFLIYYAIGLDVPADYFQTLSYKTPAPAFSLDIIPHFIICGSLMIATIVYRLIKNGYGRAFFRPGKCIWGIVLLDAALLAGGLFSAEYDLQSTLWSALSVIPLTLGYLLFYVILKHARDGSAYICKILLVLGLVVAAQAAIMACRANAFDKLFVLRNGFWTVNRLVFRMSWGISTLLAGLLVPPMAAAFWLMHKRRYPLLSFFAAILLWLCTMLITTRSAFTVGTAVMLVGMVSVCINGRNKRINRIAVASFSGALSITLICFFSNMNESHTRLLQELIVFLRLDVDWDELNAFSSSRLAIWKTGLEDFCKAPFLGVGFRYGYLEIDKTFTNLYHNMYHNIGVQMLASTGLVGAVAYAVHLWQLAKAAFYRFTVGRWLLFLVPLCIIGMSLVDNFFFYPNYLLLYAGFVAATELRQAAISPCPQEAP